MEQWASMVHGRQSLEEYTARVNIIAITLNSPGRARHTFDKHASWAAMPLVHLSEPESVWVTRVFGVQLLPHHALLSGGKNIVLRNNEGIRPSDLSALNAELQGLRPMRRESIKRSYELSMEAYAQVRGRRECVCV